jgi:hypothetical protein
MKKLRRFIEEESDESKCKDVDEDEKPSWLERAEMKATNKTLINGKEIHLKVTDGQHQLDETRHAEKLQKRCDALLKVRRDKEIRSACAILNSKNNIMNNRNNTTTTSSNVDNSNNSTSLPPPQQTTVVTVIATTLTTSISTYLMQG